MEKIMAEFIIAFMLIVAVTAYIAYPFYQANVQHISFEQNHRAEDLEARKTEIYSAIKDIEFDYEMGKLSEEDFLALREKYKAEAISVLRELDHQSQARNKKQRHHKAPKGQQRFCTQCGNALHVKDKFCSNCGTKVKS
ncbi:MAG TPA: zinc ribbon domain-containing protein [Bacteroidetes bacterium]|nr:zinc ribbon domain-containing protein [Bacteroidota bacterium]